MQPVEASLQLCRGFSSVAGACSRVLGHTGFSAWGPWAQWLWLPGSSGLTVLVALWHVGSSWIRDRTQVLRFGRQALYH